jgi:uncharacterized protein
MRRHGGIGKPSVPAGAYARHGMHTRAPLHIAPTVCVTSCTPYSGAQMLLVKTTLGPSPIHGIGLFAAQFIPQGTRIWEFTPGFDVKLSAAFVDNAPEPLKSWLATHTYRSRTSHQYILCSDDARFFNHADHPNTASREVAGEEEVITVALRDIQPGEELTDDYRTFEADFAGF